MRIMRFVTIMSAAAILLAAAVSAPTRSAAADPGAGDGPPISAKPTRPGGPGVRTIQSGESITLQKGERVRVMVPRKPFVAQPNVKDDETKLAEWLKGRKNLTFAQVQAFVAAEKLAIPAEFLTTIQNTLEGTGNTPGPSSEPGINRLQFIRTFYEITWLEIDNLGEAYRNMGIVGGVRNSGTHMADFPVSITKVITSTASQRIGVTLGAISNEVGFDVSRSEEVTVGIVVKDVGPGEHVQIRGWKVGDLVLYRYQRDKYNVYWNTVTREFETRWMQTNRYSGTAHDAQWMELESLG